MNSQYSFPHYPKRSVCSLDGLWSFLFSENITDITDLETAALEYTEGLPVPSCFDAFPAYVGKRGVGVYKRKIHILAGQQAMLVFHGLGLYAAVYVDNVLLHHWALPYSRQEVEIPAADTTERDLVIAVDNRFDRERCPLFEQYYDFYGYGGIYRSIELHRLPEKAIHRARIRILDTKRGSVRASIHMKRPVSEGTAFTLRIQGQASEHQVWLSRGEDIVEYDLDIDEPKLWSPDSPHLYTLHVESDEDSVVERFGLREISCRDGLLLLNGEPLTLKGVNRHEAHPQLGVALGLQQSVEDIQIIREMGGNFIRGSHYPQDQRFLDLCDETGMLVFEESLGWGQKSYHFSDERFCEDTLEQTRLMVDTSFNHPSVILYGFLNEGVSHEEGSVHLYRKLSSVLRAEDTQRMITYATMYADADLCYEYADVISINSYPGWYAKDNEVLRPLSEVGKELHRLREMLDSKGYGDKPMLISEIGAGAIYGFRDRMRQHWSEEYQSDYLKEACLHALDLDRCCGIAIWQYCDCRTYSTAYALMRPRAFNNKGILDEYRRPKLAYDTVKAVFAQGSV